MYVVPIVDDRADKVDTCIGYNALYVIPGVDNSNGKDLPDGFRLWCWLILFDDGMEFRDVGIPLTAQERSSPYKKIHSLDRTRRWYRLT